MLHESVVLLCRSLGEWLEPVRVMRDTHLQRPLLHAVGNGIGDAAVQTGTVIHHVNHLVVDVGTQVFMHLLFVEDILSEILRRALLGSLHFHSSFLESLLDDLKSQIVCHISL